MTSQEYQEAIDWLFVQMPNYQIDGQKAYKPGLDNIKKLCDFFGNPQDKIKTIHIGGTNGKGSTSNMLADIGNGTMNIMYINNSRPVEKKCFTEKYGTHQCMLAVRESLLKELDSRLIFA